MYLLIQTRGGAQPGIFKLRFGRSWNCLQGCDERTQGISGFFAAELVMIAEVVDLQDNT